ncbi:hypothetical protein LMG27952_02267 [Paraburkholderia hiiakae]|uniref:DUF4261 domain-containing protein n=1 Tax=Paraburkholderia hiiakae TaxID=1081782 RepID=A0ABM8NJV1_9BURK|nr:hypothetical protein [Paraburkholderia hiiakae]CAD6529152.1 hypothetical protein LMG27952_02267 [Paraburkholderia hiiakae]
MTSNEGVQTLQMTDVTLKLLSPEEPLTKTELELIQLKRYQELAGTSAKDMAFILLEQGDRPDFWIERNGQKLGLDVAAFAFDKRRQAIAQFRLIKGRLRREYRAGRLRQCVGLNIVLQFSTAFIPRPENIDPAISELVEMFEGLEPDHEAWATLDGEKWVMGEVPDPFPMGEKGVTSDGSIEWYVAGPSMHNNRFVLECGFNVEHQYLATAGGADVKQRLDKIIAKHDKADQRIDELVIIAGGPDNDGEAVFDESMLASFFVTQWQGQVETPNHAKRVVLLNWQANTLHVLYERP